MVYFNYDAVVFLKNVEMNKAVIDQYGIDMAQWESPKANLFKIGTVRVRPYQPYFRAYTLESLEFNKAALQELQEALRIDPFYAEAHDLAGKIYAKQKEYPKAFEHFRDRRDGLTRKKGNAA